jgi:phytoene desaturase
MPALDTVVIGAGLGGLASAIRLAAAGQRVLVLERNATVGGKMSEVRAAGFRFDTGPSVITMREVLEDLFVTAGQSMHDHLELLPVDPLTRYFFADGSTLDIARSLPDTLAQIARLDERDVAGYQKYLAYAARLYNITAPVFTFGPPPALASLRQVPVADALFAGGQALRSMQAAICAHVQHPHLRQLLGRFATYVGASPYLATALLSVVAHVELNGGVWYPRGGVYAIAGALEGVARKLGVEIRTGAAVTAIELQPHNKRQRVAGVRLASGEVIAGRAVIANTDVADVYSQLLPAAFGARAARLAHREVSCSGFIMLLGVAAQHAQLAHHNILFSADYAREFQQLFEQQHPPDDPTVYVAITSKTDSAHAPAGCENWFVLANVPASSAHYNWEEGRARYAELVLARLTRLGLDVRTLRYSTIFSPPDLERMSGARRGALYGVSFNTRLAPFVRPRNAAPDVGGLYFAGGTTHPGGGVPLVLLSGKLAAELVLQRA